MVSDDSTDWITATPTVFTTPDELTEHYTVINLPEIADGSHLIPDGMPIIVFYVRDSLADTDRYIRVFYSVPSAVPAGVIVMWSGAVVNIPAGWTLCDGGNDGNGNPTPDLSGRFIVGYDAGDGDYDIGDTGGFAIHGVTENDHETLDTIYSSTPPTDTFYTPDDGGGPHDTDNRPPFYTLAFIRKD